MTTWRLGIRPSHGVMWSKEQSSRLFWALQQQRPFVALHRHTTNSPDATIHVSVLVRTVRGKLLLQTATRVDEVSPENVKFMLCSSEDAILHFFSTRPRRVSCNTVARHGNDGRCDDKMPITQSTDLLCEWLPPLQEGFVLEKTLRDEKCPAVRGSATAETWIESAKVHTATLVPCTDYGGSPEPRRHACVTVFTRLSDEYDRALDHVLQLLLRRKLKEATKIADSAAKRLKRGGTTKRDGKTKRGGRTTQHPAS